MAVDSVTPTLFVISEGGDLLRWLVPILELSCKFESKLQMSSSFYFCIVFRFDCADYMREPSDIAVGGREFYVCDFKVTPICVYFAPITEGVSLACYHFISFVTKHHSRATMLWFSQRKESL